MVISEGSRLWHMAASEKGKAVGLLGWVSFLSVCGSLYSWLQSVLAIRQRVPLCLPGQPQKEAILILAPVQKSSPSVWYDSVLSFTMAFFEKLGTPAR